MKLIVGIGVPPKEVEYESRDALGFAKLGMTAAFTLGRFADENANALRETEDMEGCTRVFVRTSNGGSTGDVLEMLAASEDLAQEIYVGIIRALERLRPKKEGEA